ncbi:sensor histidine kinase [Mucilaginibacter antarcticus]|uniref:histidine kinase n=1 Tax=Mucilaginibacter antarcticus TaxID=1855725 RepID=A0ABW5XS47_9SPHI
MKLLDKYNRISLVATAVLMAITGFVYYFTISYILTGQVDNGLLVEESEIFDYVKVNHRLPQVFKSEGLIIRFQPATTNSVKREFIDIQYRDDKEKEVESSRGLVTSVKVNGTLYQVNIVASKVEAEDLIRLIFVITLSIIVALTVILALINRVVIRKLWKPFYDMLHQIKLFNLTDKNNITNLQTSITEFKDMNQEIMAMSDRVRQDYDELKRFVENASHELMTPIAVMNSKLDTLIQTNGLTQKQGELISDVYNTVAKLTRLNKAMLLLTKIENRLIDESEQVLIKPVAEAAVNEFQELFTNKGLTIGLNLSAVDIKMSKVSLEILLSNLLANAVRHNNYGGDINITLNNEGLVIQNTGSPEALEPAEIFQRFYKSAGSEGSGLGLTLAKQICTNHGFTLAYGFAGNRHIFTVGF